MTEVCFADDADQLTVASDHRNAPDAMLHKGLLFADRSIWRDRAEILSHHTLGSDLDQSPLSRTAYTDLAIWAGAL